MKDIHWSSLSRQLKVDSRTIVCIIECMFKALNTTRVRFAKHTFRQVISDYKDIHWNTMDTYKGRSQGVPSPKSHSCKLVLTFEPQWITKAWFKFIKVSSSLFYAKKTTALVLRIGTSFSSTQLSTQVPSLTFKKRWHVSIHVILLVLGLGTPCSMLSIVEIAWIDLKWVETWTWDLVWTGPKKVSIYETIHCSSFKERNHESIIAYA